jgi:O-antigen/teichoic acid export membrane protein
LPNSSDRWPRSPSRILVQLLRGAAWLVSGSGISRAANLFALVLVARVLGPAEFGFFSIVQVLAMYGAIILGAGMPVATVKFFSSPRGLSAIFLSRAFGVFYVYLFSVLLFGAGTAFFVGIVRPSIFEADIAFLALVLCVVAIARALQDATLSSSLNFRKIAKLRLCESLLFLVSAPFIAAHFGARGVIFCSMGTGFLAFAYGAFGMEARISAAALRPSFRRLGLMTKKFVAFSVPTTLAVVVPSAAILISIYWLGQSADGIVDVALYNASYQWLGPITFVAMSVASVGYPMMSIAWDSNQKAQYWKIYVRLLGVAVLASTVSASALLLGRPLLGMMYGEAFGGLFGLFFWVALAAPGKVAMDTAIVALQASGRHAVLVAMTAVWTAIFAVLLFMPGSSEGAATILRAIAFAYLCVGVLVAVSVAKMGFRTEVAV